MITDIDLENSLAEISIGSVNGVKEGMWFHVFRGDKFICNIVILDVESEKAVGTLDLIDITQEQPKAGDTVQTELSLSQQAAKRDVINRMQSSSIQSEHVDVLTNSIGMRLVHIPKGEFMMGSPSSKEERFGNEGPQHRVRISRDFYMSQTEVTQGQYKSVMNTQPWSGESYVQESDSNPAVYVSWNDAVEFCRKLSQQEGKTYRLPTEAEWEYACRAGTTTCFSFGDSDSSLGDYAWFCGNAWDVDQKYAHRVGQKKPNRWNLYDMHGNVFEWCNDWYDRNYYSNSPVFDPQGPASGSSRVVRLFGMGGDYPTKP